MPIVSAPLGAQVGHITGALPSSAAELNTKKLSSVAGIAGNNTRGADGLVHIDPGVGPAIGVCARRPRRHRNGRHVTLRQAPDLHHAQCHFFKAHPPPTGSAIHAAAFSFLLYKQALQVVDHELWSPLARSAQCPPAKHEGRVIAGSCSSVCITTESSAGAPSPWRAARQRSSRAA